MSEDELLKDLIHETPRQLRDKLEEIIRVAYEEGVADGKAAFLAIVSQTDVRVQRVIENARPH